MHPSDFQLLLDSVREDVLDSYERVMEASEPSAGILEVIGDLVDGVLRLVLGVIPAAPFAIIVSLAFEGAIDGATYASCSPDQCDLHAIRTLVEQLAALLIEGT